MSCPSSEFHPKGGAYYNRNIMSCLVCFNIISDKNIINCSKKLFKICCRYLHSEIAKENVFNTNPDNSSNLPVCQMCFKSAIDLANVAEQLEYFQKCVAELGLTFSLGVLYRRGKRNVDKNNRGNNQEESNYAQFLSAEKKLVEFDVFGILPESNNDGGSSSSNPFQSGVSAEVILIPENPENFPNEVQSVEVDEQTDSDEDLAVYYPTSDIKSSFQVMTNNTELDEDIVLSKNDLSATYTNEEILSQFSEPPSEADTSPRTNQGSLLPKVQVNDLLFRVRQPEEEVYTNSNDDPFEISMECWNVSSSKRSTGKQQFTFTHSELPTPIPLIKVEKLNDEVALPDEANFPTSGNLKNPRPSHRYSTRSKLTWKKSTIGEKPFKCNVCNKGFKIKQSLLYHTRIHTGDNNMFNCDVCGKGFHLKISLRIHKMIHTEEKPFKCDICDKGLSSKNAMINHRAIHSSQCLHKCGVCKKRFIFKNSLLIHQRIHNGDKPFKCDICYKQLTTKQAMLIHKRIHTGDKPFKCDLCGKGFTVKQSLIFHKQSHTGEKPFKCDICQKGLATKFSMINHKRLHTGDKPFNCNICGKSFPVKHSLEAHKITHTGEKPFKCDICDKRFGTRQGWKNHKLIHTGEKPFKCYLCDEHFRLRRLMQVHMKNVHANEIIDISLEQLLDSNERVHSNPE